MEIIRSRTRNRFPGRRPARAAISLAALLLGAGLDSTAIAADDRALSPPVGHNGGSEKQPPPGLPLTDEGPHHRWRRPTEKGQRPAVAPGQGGTYVELATGLNRWDSRRRVWVPAEARFEPNRDGHFLARTTQHQVILAPDLNVQSAVDLLTPDGIRLQSTILGLALVDAASGQSVMLAELKNCQGVPLSTNEVIFQDAFDGLLADVRYVITLDRFEQDVILRERIPVDMIQELGLDPNQTRLLVLTEFFAPPQPGRKTRHLPLAEGQALGDEELAFGSMSMSAGQAGRRGSEGPDVPVYKSWEVLDGRQFLIEIVPYPSLLLLSENLPVVSRERMAAFKAKLRRTAGVDPNRVPAAGAASGLQPPESRPRPASRQAHSVPMDTEDDGAPPRGLSGAASPPGAPSRSALLADGIVIDYPLTLTSGLTDFTFKGDTTYYVTGTVSLGGTTTLEGGCVIKFAPGGSAGLILDGPVTCQTSPYRPAILTARDDDSVGEAVSGSSGNPLAVYYGQPALQIMRGGQTLHDLRIAHAQTALFFHDYSAGSNSVRHVQFVRCGAALKLNGYGTSFQRFVAHNLLIHNSSQPFVGYSFNVRGEHLTLCQATQLATDTRGYLYNTTSSLSLVNSLLVSVTNLGNAVLTQSSCRTASQSNAVFQTVGAGGFYLANSSFRNAGTTNLHPTLAQELTQRTTQPPTVLTGSVASDLTLLPAVARDPKTPDLGYHYARLDAALGTVTIPGGRSLTIRPDTAVAVFGPYGVRLDPGARLQAEGEPLRPIRIVRYSQVHEQPTLWGAVAANPVAIMGTDQPAATGLVAPSARFRFAGFLASAGPGYHIYSDGATSRFLEVSFQDCEVEGGRLVLGGVPGTTVALQNNLVDRAFLSFGQAITLTIFNNLVRGGAARFERSTGAGPWVIRDSIFHENDLIDSAGGILHSHNAYVGSLQRQLGGASSGNIPLALFPYVSGPLGRYYQGATNFHDRGSRSAAAAGLYHYTVRTNQVKETATQVDLGFHYVASWDDLGAAQTQDADRDGIADYLEDANGDGRANSGETDWQDARDLGLQIRITRPRRSSTVP